MKTRRSQEKPRVLIHSFAYKKDRKNAPVFRQKHGGNVFDCRTLPNPFWDEKLRLLTGKDKKIAQFFKTRRKASAFVSLVSKLIFMGAREFKTDTRKHLYVYFGCTGGRHRSVYMAETVGKHLKRHGYKVDVKHIDLKRS